MNTFSCPIFDSQSPYSTRLPSLKKRPKLLSVAHLAALFFFLVVCGGYVFAQSDMDPSLPGSSLEITGQIRPAEGQKSAEFVTVRLERASGGLVEQRTTDSSGRFRFSQLASGQYTVSAKSPGFIVAPQVVDVNRFMRRNHLLLQLVPETPNFDTRNASRRGVVDANVPEKASKEMERAREALAKKKMEEGILHLEKAVSVFPKFLEAQILLGSTYMDAGQLSKAEDALRVALKIDPKSASVMVSLGELFRRQKNYSKAEQMLLEALKYEETAWVGHYTLGRVYWETNEIVKAGREIGRTIQLNSEFAEAHLLGGNIFVRLGMPENAIVEYEEYLRIAPQGQLAPQAQQLIEKLRRSLQNRKQ